MELLIYTLLFCIAIGIVTAEPCNVYEDFTADSARAPSYTEPVYANKLCDAVLSTKWYRLVGDAGSDLTNDSSVLVDDGCGTSYQLWMNGTIPEVSEGEVDRQICMRSIFSICHSSFTIKVKNCCSYQVYQLKSATNCPQAYCVSTSLVPPFTCSLFTTTTPATTTTTVTTTTTTTTPVGVTSTTVKQGSGNNNVTVVDSIDSNVIIIIVVLLLVIAVAVIGIFIAVTYGCKGKVRHEIRNQTTHISGRAYESKPVVTHKPIEIGSPPASVELPMSVCENGRPPVSAELPNSFGENVRPPAYVELPNSVCENGRPLASVELPNSVGENGRPPVSAELPNSIGENVRPPAYAEIFISRGVNVRPPASVELPNSVGENGRPPASVELPISVGENGRPPASVELPNSVGENGRPSAYAELPNSVGENGMVPTSEMDIMRIVSPVRECSIYLDVNDHSNGMTMRTDHQQTTYCTLGQVDTPEHFYDTTTETPPQSTSDKARLENEIEKGVAKNSTTTLPETAEVDKQKQFPL